MYWTVAAGHVTGHQCRCNECGKLKMTDNKWIMRLGTFEGNGGNDRNKIKLKGIGHWDMRCITQRQRLYFGLSWAGAGAGAVERGAQSVLVRSGRSWGGAVEQGTEVGGRDGGGAAEGAGGGQVVTVEVWGGAVVVPEAVTSSMSAPWNNFISI